MSFLSNRRRQIGDGRPHHITVIDWLRLHSHLILLPRYCPLWRARRPQNPRRIGHLLRAFVFIEMRLPRKALSALSAAVRLHLQMRITVPAQ